MIAQVSLPQRRGEEHNVLDRPRGNGGSHAASNARLAGNLGGPDPRRVGRTTGCYRSAAGRSERTEEPKPAAIPAAGEEHRIHEEVHDAANSLGRARSARDVVLRESHTARTTRQSGGPGCPER